VEADLDAVDFFHAARDQARREVDTFRDFDAVQVDHGVEAALGKDVDQHGQGQRVGRTAGSSELTSATPEIAWRSTIGMIFLSMNVDDLGRRAPLCSKFVAVEPFHQFLAGVDDDLAGHGHAAQAVDRARVELERALVFELLEDVLLDLVRVPCALMKW
jgi:hypothetical protein